MTGQWKGCCLSRVSWSMQVTPQLSHTTEHTYSSGYTLKTWIACTSVNALILSSVVHVYSVFYLYPSFSPPLVLNTVKTSKESSGSPYHTNNVYTKRDEAKKKSYCDRKVSNLPTLPQGSRCSRIWGISTWTLSTYQNLWGKQVSPLAFHRWLVQ